MSFFFYFFPPGLQPKRIVRFGRIIPCFVQNYHHCSLWIFLTFEKIQDGRHSIFLFLKCYNSANFDARKSCNSLFCSKLWLPHFCRILTFWKIQDGRHSILNIKSAITRSILKLGRRVIACFARNYGQNPFPKI